MIANCRKLSVSQRGHLQTSPQMAQTQRVAWSCFSAFWELVDFYERLVREGWDFGGSPGRQQRRVLTKIIEKACFSEMKCPQMLIDLFSQFPYFSRFECSHPRQNHSWVLRISKVRVKLRVTLRVTLRAGPESWRQFLGNCIFGWLLWNLIVFKYFSIFIVTGDFQEVIAYLSELRGGYLCALCRANHFTKMLDSFSLASALIFMSRLHSVFFKKLF